MNNSVIEGLLARDGRLVYKTRGVSMEPMLRQNRDLVVIQVPSSRLRKFDVALYKRGEKYVLHRVVAVKDGYYIIRGDNTYALENVPNSAVIGVLHSFKRNGRQVSVEDRVYQFYVRFWSIIYPLRVLYMRFRRLAVKAARRLGILPLIKKILAK